MSTNSPQFIKDLQSDEEKKKKGKLYDIIFCNLKHKFLESLKGWYDQNDVYYSKCQNFLIMSKDLYYPFSNKYSQLILDYLEGDKSNFISNIGVVVESNIREMIILNTAQKQFPTDVDSNLVSHFQMCMEMRNDLKDSKPRFYSISIIKNYLESILEGTSSSKKPSTNQDNSSKFGQNIVSTIQKLERQEIEELINELKQIIEIRHPMAHFNPSQILDIQNNSQNITNINQIGKNNFVMPYTAMPPKFVEKYYMDLLTDDFLDLLFIVAQKIIYKFSILFN